MQRDARIYVAGGRDDDRQRASSGASTPKALTLDRRRTRRARSTGPRRPSTRSSHRRRPEYVFVAAGETAGIVGNSARPGRSDDRQPARGRPRDSGRVAATARASCCIWPARASTRSMRRSRFSPSSLWTGPVEPTSAAYAVAKLAGVALCDAYRRQHGAPFIAAIGADAYGPGDDFSPENSHVVGALIRRMHEARAAQRAVRRGLGIGHAATRVHLRGRPRRRLHLRDAALRRRRRRSTSERASTRRSRSWRRRSATSSASAASCDSIAAGRTACRSRDSTRASSTTSGGVRRGRLPEGWKRPIVGI